jgi:hypothetical protein
MGPSQANQLSKIIFGVRLTDGIEVVKPKAQAPARLTPSVTKIQ